MYVLLQDPEWKASFEAIRGDVKEILDETRHQEYDWGTYLFSGGRAIIGLNAQLLADWTDYNCAPIYDYYQIERDFTPPKRDPMPLMRKWMYPTEQQTANQEISNTDYRLNTVADDIGDEDLSW